MLPFFETISYMVHCYVQVELEDSGETTPFRNHFEISEKEQKRNNLKTEPIDLTPIGLECYSENSANANFRNGFAELSGCQLKREEISTYKRMETHRLNILTIMQ